MVTCEREFDNVPVVLAEYWRTVVLDGWYAEDVKVFGSV